MRTAEAMAAGSVVSAARTTMPLQRCAGFFFAARMLVTYLAFQSDPRSGAAFTAAAGLALFVVVASSKTKEDAAGGPGWLRAASMRWLAIYLAFTCASLLWSQTESGLAAMVYWCGMMLDAATGVLLVRGVRAEERMEEVMRGFITGALVVAAVAWCSPTLPDLRMGNEEFLHPNALGFVFALAFLFAQHLAARSGHGRWTMVVLGVSLLRTISKTSIVACVIAECFYLLQSKSFSRRAKLWTVVGMLAVMAAGWGLLQSYLSGYLENNQVETLTGRTQIWAITLVMGLEQPWFGHGFYSFRGLIPALGTFEPWHAHNEVLQQFFEFGAAGVALTGMMYLTLGREGLRQRRSPYGALTVTLVLLCLVRGLTDTVNFGLSMPFWLMAGLAAVLVRGEETAA